MKKFKYTIFYIFCLVLIIILGCYVVCFGFKQATDYQIYKKKQITTKIYTVWHIETFEGGSKARINFLKSVATEIEKQNSGILFMFKQVEPTNLENELNVCMPNIISFGFGVGKIVLPKLTELNNTFEVRDNLIKSATFASKLMCLPYITSGYAHFTHASNIETTFIGNSNFINPENALAETNINITKNENSYEAYKSFIYNKKSALIGTGRDVFRVSNLNNIGRLNASITPLFGYTDLIQYCGLTANDEISLQFLTKLLSDNFQNKLTTYSLFSVKHNKIYSSGIYKNMENAIFEANVPNVFNEQRFKN